MHFPSIHVQVMDKRKKHTDFTHLNIVFKTDLKKKDLSFKAVVNTTEIKFRLASLQG